MTLAPSWKFGGACHFALLLALITGCGAGDPKGAAGGASASTATSGDGGAGAGGAGAGGFVGGGGGGGAPSCKPKRILAAGGSDETSALTALLADASSNPETDGPAGQQGRVYLAPGLHRFVAVAVPSDVLIEIDPGATLTAVESTPTGDKKENPLFTLGSTTEVHNITIIAGDGCGGPGTPTLSNKLKNTGDRGNSESNGMSNMAVPHDPRWPIETFFVFDVDPKFRHVPSGTFAIRVGWATDVLVSHFFSIQNPERKVGANGVGTGPTVNFSEGPVVKPRALPTSTFEAPELPTRLTMEWVYNVLSPSGWGPVQVQACLGCTFRHLFSHGGVTLRMETDNAEPLCGHDVCGGCTMSGQSIPPVDDQGHGLKFYARVDALEGEDIENALGNAVVYFTPHCQHNGYAHVKKLRGQTTRTLVSVSEGGATATGVFASNSLVEDVVGTLDLPGKAQDPNPHAMTYNLFAPQEALLWTATLFTAKTSGTFCWPAALKNLQSGSGAMAPDPVPIPTHGNCPAP